jgi:hypothetical protein
MLTCEGRALVTEIQDRLIELYVQQDEARREHDPDRAHELQVSKLIRPQCSWRRSAAEAP